MQTTPWKLRLAQNEVHRGAHNQDLTEVPKRAMLDREVEGIGVPAGAAHEPVSEDAIFDPASLER
jgi:hypothetical protein